MDRDPGTRSVASESVVSDRWRGELAPGAVRGRLMAAGSASLALYAVLAALGDLHAHLVAYLVVHSVLFVLYAWVVLGLVREGTRRRPPNGRGAAGEDPPGAPHRPGSIPVSEVSPAGESAFAVGPRPPTPGFPRQRPQGSTQKNGPAASWLRGVLQRPGGAVAIFVFAVLFRAVLVVTPASLSDDIHRYVWDGRVQASGKNPYRTAPDAEALRGLRDAGWERINHKEIKTIYPPAAEVLFLASAAAGLRETGFKILFCLFDLGVLAALAAFLHRTGQSPFRAAVYAWNPLVVVEVASSGHSDPVGLCLVVVSAGLILGGQFALSIAAWAASVLSRLLPAIFAPIFVRRAKLHHLLLGAAILILVIAPYSGARGDLLSGLTSYAENWDYNSVVFPALRAGLEAVVDVEWLKSLVTWFKDAIGDPAWCQVLYRWVYPGPLTRVLLFLALAIGLFEISVKVGRIERELLLATGLLLVLSPTLHPWYLLWIVAFAAIEWSPSWILFSGLAPLSYLSARSPDGRVPLWVLAVEWGIPCVTALVLSARRGGSRR